MVSGGIICLPIEEAGTGSRTKFGVDDRVVGNTEEVGRNLLAKDAIQGMRWIPWRSCWEMDVDKLEPGKAIAVTSCAGL